MHKIVSNIMAREKVSAEKLAPKCKVSPESFRRMLRGEINMDVDIFSDALAELGYKIIIAKKEDLI